MDVSNLYQSNLCKKDFKLLNQKSIDEKINRLLSSQKIFLKNYVKDKENTVTFAEFKSEISNAWSEGLTSPFKTCNW